MLRSYLFLISLSLVLTALSSYFFWSSYTSEGQEASVADIQDAKREFKSKHRYIIELTEKEMDQQLAASTLRDPKSILPQLNKNNISELRQLHNYEKNCEQPNTLPSSFHLKKAWQWQAFLCGDQNKLPQNFFKNTPFIHPFGGSYSFRAVKSKANSFDSSIWIMEHFQTFHLLEWKKLRRFIKSASSYHKTNRVLSNFDMATLEDLEKKQDLIISTRFVFLRDLSRSLEKPFSYLVYSKKSFKKFLNKSRFQVRYFHPQKSCILKEGNWCWDYNHRSIHRKINNFSVSLTILLFISMLFSIWITLRWLKKQEIDREHKSLMLSTLTHELRTPVTSMVLAIQNIKKNFNQIPEEIQDDFFSILDGTSRLNNVVERSSQYIQQSARKVIQTNPDLIPSLSDFLEAICEGQGIDCQIDIGKNLELKTDTYWLAICLGNLLRNALEHGKPPYLLKVVGGDDYIFFHLQDAGELLSNDLNKLRQEFTKSPKSRGLGLGLYLVSNIAKALGGDLQLSNNPTIFTLKVRKNL